VRDKKAANDNFIKARARASHDLLNLGNLLKIN